MIVQGFDVLARDVCKAELYTMLHFDTMKISLLFKWLIGIKDAS